MVIGFLMANYFFIYFTHQNILIRHWEFGLNNVYKELIGPNGNVIRIPIEEHEKSWDMFKWIEYFKNSEILS